MHSSIVEAALFLALELISYPINSLLIYNIEILEK